MATWLAVQPVAAALAAAASKDWVGRCRAVCQVLRAVPVATAIPAKYPGETAAQRKARLEGELEESVGGFDEVLAEEQREISTVSRDTEGFGGAGGGGGSGRVGLGRQEGVRGAGDNGAGSQAGAGNAAGGGSTPSVAGMSEDEIKSRTPADIPDLVSEDIVAKQLREAALAEEDPELRERLWDEYRRYNRL